MSFSMPHDCRIREHDRTVRKGGEPHAEAVTHFRAVVISEVAHLRERGV
jgi:hypothetical protein